METFSLCVLKLSLIKHFLNEQILRYDVDLAKKRF